MAKLIKRTTTVEEYETDLDAEIDADEDEDLEDSSEDEDDEPSRKKHRRWQPHPDAQDTCRFPPPLHLGRGRRASFKASPPRRVRPASSRRTT